MEKMTNDWALYEAGKNYNNRLEPNYYETVNANLDFFAGNQWRNLPDIDMPKPVFNFIKRVITFFVASMTTSKVKLHYESLMLADNTPELEIDAADVANKQTEMLLEKFKIEFKVREALFDGANTGDYCAHFYFDYNKRPYNYAPGIKGEICFELVDGANVFFGNANNPNTDIQPYIIISGRETVQKLKEEAQRYQASEQDINNIKMDNEYEYQSGYGGQIEVEADESGKALYIIVYRKVKKTRKIRDEFGEEVDEEYYTITASKSVRNAYIYKDIDTGLSVYPVAWANWEKQKNQYHGRALTTGMLPNQIFINRMFAMVMYHLMMTAFPKAVYNADFIDVWDNAIGEAIPVKGMQLGENIKNIAGYLEPGNMSAQIVQVIELVVQYTKETLGISDASLGNIDPKNTSAIIAVQKSAAIPLENPKANLYEWVEDIGRILFDMMGTYYGLRPIVREVDGKKITEMFDFSVFKDMWLDVKANVGESSYWSQIAASQTLDNLLQGGYLDIIDYLERQSDEYIPQKQELIDTLKARMGDPFSILEGLTPQEQVTFLQQPPEVRRQMVEQLKKMRQQPQPQPGPIGVVA